MAIQFREGSYAEKIVSNIALTGEFPYSSLYLMKDSDRINKRYVLNLRKESFVTVNGNGPIKTIRLTKKAFDVINEINPGMLDHYMRMSDNHHFRGAVAPNNTNIWRKHRIAEVYMMMKNIDAKVWHYEKPELKLLQKNNIIDTSETSYFYDSIEVKNVDERQLYKVSFTRVIGLLMSAGGNYSVYNTNKGLMKWNKYGEEKSKLLINDLLRNNLANKTADINSDSAIMFGKDMDVAFQILESNDKRRDERGFELLSFDNTFKNIHFLTLDEYGEKQLKILTQPNWHQTIRDNMFPESMINFKSSNFECDAIDDKKHILMFFDGNIGRLKRFKQLIFDIGLNNMEVLCFPWQENMIKKYIPNVNTTTVDIDVIMVILGLN